MKKETISTDFIVHSVPTTLTPEDRALISKAREQLDVAYAPYSNFYVGAALSLENGEILTGCNQENASYPLCTCGEHAAVVKAGTTYPGVKIEVLAIVAKNPKLPVEKPVTPCGACRQIIAEYEQRQGCPIRLLLQGESGNIYEFEGIAALLPLSFDRSYL